MLLNTGRVLHAEHNDLVHKDGSHCTDCAAAVLYELKVMSTASLKSVQ